MRNLDLSSWRAMLFSFIGIALVTLIGVAIRVVHPAFCKSPAAAGGVWA